MIHTVALSATLVTRRVASRLFYNADLQATVIFVRVA
jgi:hypothetical protein